MRALYFFILPGCGLDPIGTSPDLTDSGLTDSDDVLMIGNLQVSPSSLDFGDILLNADVSQEITLSNTGSDTVSLSSAYLDGDTAYTLTIASTPLDISSGEDISMVIGFSPDAEQTYSGTLNLLVSGEADFAIVDITGVGSLTGGTGTGDDTGDTDTDLGTTGISVSTDTISFGTVDIGNTESESVTITNTGSVEVMLQDVATTAAGVVEGDLETPMLLEEGESTTFSVTYTPTDEVNTTAILTIENDSGEEPEIAVTGTGYQNCTICSPVLAVSTGGSNSSSMDQFASNFGSADAQTLLIYNNGDTDLEISDITLTNDTTSSSTLICGTAGSYTMSSLSTTTIGAYSSASVTVTYTFSGSGVCGEVSLYPLSYENTIVIESNDLSYPEYVITLGGTGLGI
jgi:hypothetical protein